jgi:hypothetical protein
VGLVYALEMPKLEKKVDDLVGGVVVVVENEQREALAMNPPLVAC